MFVFLSKGSLGTLGVCIPPQSFDSEYWPPDCLAPGICFGTKKKKKNPLSKNLIQIPGTGEEAVNNKG